MAARRSSRFVISPFRHSVQTDPQYAQRTWAALKSAIAKINDRNTSELSFEELYRYSYNMVLHKHGDVLYNGLTKVLSDHLQAVAASISATDSAAFLTQLQTQWMWFKISLSHTRDVLMYMDNTYVPSRRKKSVHDLGVSLFRDHVVRNESIAPRLIDAVLADIDRERSGEAIDCVLIRAVTRLLVQLGDDVESGTVYVNLFENAFLERTRQFYAREAQFYFTEASCSDYLRKAAQRMHEEEVRVESYLDSQTGEKVRKVAEHELISTYMKLLVEMENSGLIWMLRNDKCYDLQLMYSLFRSVPNGEEELRVNLKNEVLNRGSALINDGEDSNDPVALVSSILALKDKYDRILSIAFSVPASQGSGSYMGLSGDPGASSGGDPGGGFVAGLTASATAAAVAASAAFTSGVADTSQCSEAVPAAFTGASAHSAGLVRQHSEGQILDRKFVTAVNEAFERFVNSFGRSAEYISLYVDKLLRQDLKGTSDDEIESKLDQVMTLFRYLHEKDVFETYYKQHLSKRLLSNRTTSHDAERSFISKLKNECGYLYTSKMETMFTDVRTSAETTDAFKAQIENPEADLGNVDLNVSILTTISWPVASVASCTVPPAIARCCTRFESFYFSKHEGRRLTWQTQMASAEVRGFFGNRTRQIDLGVSAYGACILMLFNDRERLTYNEIAAATNIPVGELVRNLQSLAMGKHRVLVKDPRSREINGRDSFIVNDEFTSRTRRLKIQMVSAQKESEAEKSKTRSRIDEDRKPLIEAAIVRIMKDRKVLEHQQLVAQVTLQLAPRFEPNPQDIKRRIESLVDREFLERKADMRSTYCYIA